MVNGPTESESPRSWQLVERLGVWASEPDSQPKLRLTPREVGLLAAALNFGVQYIQLTLAQKADPAQVEAWKSRAQTAMAAFDKMLAGYDGAT